MLTSLLIITADVSISYMCTLLGSTSFGRAVRAPAMRAPLADELTTHYTGYHLEIPFNNKTLPLPLRVCALARIRTVKEEMQ